MAGVLMLAAGLTATAPASPAAGRQGELAQALRNRYRLTLIGPRMLGLTGGRSTVRSAGGVVVVRRGGLYGSVDPDQPASFAIREGKAELYRGRKTQPLAVGDRFYVHSLQVGSNVVTLGLLSLQTASTPGGSGELWAAVSFFLPPAVVAEADLTKVTRVVDQWLAPEGAYGPAVAEAPAVAPPAAAPADLQLGMTRDEVLAALGPPQREASFGIRTWLTYAGMVVLLEQGKLVSVDRSGQPPAKVSVVSEPDGADVYLDGSYVGSTPARLELPAGTYRVSMRLPGYQEWQRELRVLAGSELTLRARLEK